MSVNLNPSNMATGQANNGRRYTGADSATQVVLSIVITALVTIIVLGITYGIDKYKIWRQNK